MGATQCHCWDSGYPEHGSIVTMGEDANGQLSVCFE